MEDALTNELCHAARRILESVGPCGELCRSCASAYRMGLGEPCASSFQNRNKA